MNMLRGPLLSYFGIFLLFIFLNCNIRYGQTVGRSTENPSDLNGIVEYVKTHETFFPTVMTVQDKGLVIGYSFLMTASGTPNEGIFNSLFGGTLDYDMVRNGVTGINEVQATQLLKESLEQVMNKLGNEGITLSSYSFDVKKGLIDAEFAMILPSEVKPLLNFDPAWQRICLSVRTASEDENERCFDNCRSICSVPVYVEELVSTYDSCTDRLFFPFGLNFWDSIVPANDDGSSGRIELSTFFPFYDQFHDSLFVNTNGIISFDDEFSQYYQNPLRGSSIGNWGDRPLIAPFWADVSTLEGGTIYYREMTRRDDEDLAKILDKLISESLIVHKNFELIWYLVATWDQVAYYGTDENNINNTFQAILVTDGRYSFTIFNYGDIQWTTGSYLLSGGDRYGLGGGQAQVGFNAGDGTNYYSVPGSQTHEIVNIEETSNVGIAGRYIFGIGGQSVMGFGCQDGSEYDVAGSLVIYPGFGSMLGGIETLVQGPCFKSTDNIICKFIDEVNGPTTQCIYRDERTVACVVPILLRTGRTRVFLSTDGGNNYAFRGIFTSVNIDEVTEDLQTKVQFGSRRIIWPYKAALGLYYDIDILVYDDEHSDPTTMEIINIENDTYFDQPNNNVFEYTFAEDITLNTDKNVGLIRVSQGEEEPGEQYGLPSSFWSDPFDLSIFTNLKVQTWCSDWKNVESQNTVHISSSELRCPCNLQSALLDRGRFSPSPRCSNGIADSCSDEDNVIHCVRSIIPSIEGHGLECCYNRDGVITNIDDNLDSGYAHRFHHSGQEPFDISGRVPYLSHFTHDILPYIRCCNNFDECRSYFIPVRPSQSCQGYEPPRPARMNGDPHFQTLDGFAYTFNGHGEYYLMYGLNGSFVMQGRTEPLPDTGSSSINATRFTAIAAQFNKDTKVHVALNEVQGLVVHVTEDSQWSRISFDDIPFWKNTGIDIVYTKGTKETNVAVTIAFNFGLVFTVEAISEIMSIVVVGPETMRGNTTGLLGNWNGNTTDDLQTPDGRQIPSNSSMETIHYQFGEKWRVVSEESVLYYTFGTSYKTYNKTDFEPWFEQPNNINETEVKQVCGDNFECVFDYQVTGNAEIAKVTKEAVETFQHIKEILKPVVSCGFVYTPLNGSKSGSVYTEGGVITFSCNEGFTLNGSSIITCSKDGFWSDNVPTCIRLEESVPTIEEQYYYLTIVISVVIGSLVVVLLVGMLLTCLRKTRTKMPLVFSNEGAGVDPLP